MIFEIFDLRNGLSFCGKFKADNTAMQGYVPTSAMEACPPREFPVCVEAQKPWGMGYPVAA